MIRFGLDRSGLALGGNSARFLSVHSIFSQLRGGRLGGRPGRAVDSGCAADSARADQPDRDGESAPGADRNRSDGPDPTIQAAVTRDEVGESVDLVDPGRADDGHRAVDTPAAACADRTTDGDRLLVRPGAPVAPPECDL